MATWIAHLRIAENILEDSKDIQREAFVADSIAPDAGVPNEEEPCKKSRVHLAYKR